MKRGRRKENIVIKRAVYIAIGLLILYFAMLPMGAVRLQLLSGGYVTQAFSCKKESQTDLGEGNLEKDEMIITLKNAPKDADTGRDMDSWIVKRTFYVFYMAAQSGETDLDR